MGERISRDMILWFFLALFLVSIFLLGWLLWPFVSIIVLAAVVTGVFKPLYNALSQRLNATPASLITCVVVFVVLFVPIVLFVGILANEAYDLWVMGREAVISDQVQTLLANNRVLERINLFLARFNLELTGAELNNAISQLGIVVGRFLFEQANAIAANFFRFLLNFFLMLLVIYFLLIDSDRLIAFVIDLSPLPAEQEQKLFQKFKDIAGAILIGNGFGGLIQGILGGLAFYFFGLKSPFLWGVIMALLAFLPIVGIGVVFIPVAIYLALKGQLATAIFFVVFYLILSGGIEYLFKPKLVGRRVQMHTLLVFLAIIGGLNLFGILGIIYGPLIATAFLTLTDIYHASYQQLVETRD